MVYWPVCHSDSTFISICLTFSFSLTFTSHANWSKQMASRVDVTSMEIIEVFPSHRRFTLALEPLIFVFSFDYAKCFGTAMAIICLINKSSLID